VDAKTQSGPPAKALTLRLDGGPTFECLRIEPGRFMMGSPNSDKDALPEEKPQREVQIENAFYIGRTTVTFGQFQEFILDTSYRTDAERDRRPNYRGGHGFNVDRKRFEGYFPQYTWRNPGWAQTKDQTQDHPVGNVSWNDAQKFCEWLSKKTGKQVRLPTEAEWEYACRAGTTTRFYTGDDPANLKGYANVPDEALRKKLGEHADPTVFFPFDDGYPFTAPVAHFKPNPWGLHDMLGNVFQWCADEIPDAGVGPRPFACVVPPPGHFPHCVASPAPPFRSRDISGTGRMSTTTPADRNWDRSSWKFTSCCRDPMPALAPRGSEP
jgi:formylglycine-generating enzyme required for sulfatase activity